MKLVSHIFDSITDSPIDGASVTVHCGKKLTVRPIDFFTQKTGPLETCKICRQKSEQFMASHPNVFVHTLFVLEEVEIVKEGEKR